MAQQWEYCIVYHGTTTFYGISGEISQTVPDAEAIARLGAAEWELAAIAPGDGIYFKRPVQPGRRIDDAF